MTFASTYLNTAIATPEPDWYKAERYAYCESFIVERRRKRIEFLNQLWSLFKR